MHRLLKVNLILIVLSLFLLRLNSFALPEVETIVEGSATFSNPDSNTLEINAIDKTIINYQSFDIKNNESVTISLPSVDSQILNRVLGDKASKILGNLYCNGILILINQNGIYFGPNSNVDVGGLIASTRDITNSNFLSSKYIFEKLSPEQLDMLLLNQGKINISSGGFGVLIAGAIENSGIISAPVGTIAFAAGDMVTLDISTDGLISIAIDKPTAAKVYDLDGNPITDQIKNTGTIEAEGGSVWIKAESLPGLFEKAINLEGYVKADRLSVAGESLSITSLATLTEVYKSGDIRLTSSYIQDNLLTLEGEGFKVTYLANSNLTLQADNSINTTPGLIIQANNLKLIAKQFGSLEVPLTLSASLTYIYRLSGNIDILESLGIGTSIMLRGPPATGFGAIIYSKDTHLTLESPSGSLSLSSAVSLIAKNLTLISLQGIYSYGNLVADETITLKSSGAIISYGSLKTPLLYEEGASFSIGGTYQVGYAYLTNLDNAVILDTGDYSGEITEVDNIILNNNALINLIGNTIFRADSNQGGVGSFTMNTGSSIVSNGYDLSIYASQGSTLRTITGVGTLTLTESKAGSSPTYTAYSPLSVNNLYLDKAGLLLFSSLSVSKDMSVRGDLWLENTSFITIAGNLTVIAGQIRANLETSSFILIRVKGNLSFIGTEYVYFGEVDLATGKDYRFSLELEGNLTLANPNAWIYANIILVGSKNQAIDYTAGTLYGNIELNKPLGEVSYNGLNLSGLPLYFVQNLGQIGASEVKFYLYFGNSRIYFTPQAVVYSITQASSPESTTVSYFKLNFLGANTLTSIEPYLVTETSFNYFLGDDPNKWTTNIPSYYKIVYPGLYAGIDLIYSSKSGQLESEFVLTQGANPLLINLSYQGIKTLSIDAEGNLIIDTGYATLKETKPYAYQDIQGTRREVRADFVLLSENTYGFKVGDYDPNYPLIIDPSLSYSTFIGGSGNDVARALAIDSSGNVYITGDTADAATDYPTTAGAYDTTLNAGNEVFVSKLNATGTGLTYSTFIGGSGNDVGYALAIDSSGNAYITGYTADAATDYPTTTGAYDTTQNGNNDVFVTKLNATGTDLTYSTFIGGSGSDIAYALAIDSSGNVYITGETADAATDYPTTAGAYDTTHNGSADVFVTKLNSDGTGLTYSTFLGGSGNDYGRALAIDSSGNVYITGQTADAATDYPTTTGAYDTTQNGDDDVFVTKINATGTDLTYSTFIGGSDNDYGYSLVIDSSGNVYITGETQDAATDYPTTSGAYDTTHNGGDAFPIPNPIDVFVTKLNATGTDLTYSTFIGGSSNDSGRGIAIDSSGNAYITGETYDAATDYPTTAGAYDTTHNGGIDVFLTELNATGTSLTYSTFMGGSGSESGRGIAIDSSGNVYITGQTQDAATDYPTTSGAYNTTHNGSNDVFVSKFTPSISATIYTNEAKTTNVGSGVSASISINGGAKSTATTDADGKFFFFYVSISANDTLLLFIDDNGSYEANLISQAVDSTTSITGLELYTSKIVLRHETSGPMTNSLLATADDSADDDVHWTISGANVTFDTGYEVWIDSSMTYTPGGAVTLDSLDINGTFTMEANSVTVSGNWDPTGGSFSSSGTVTFNGTGTSQISGSTTFYNLTSTTAGKTLNFEAGTTQTITGTLTFTGSSGNPIYLRSQTTGSQWKIDPQGTWSISYVDVKDSNNIHSTRINPSNSNDSGNNINWFPTILTATEIEEATKSTYTINIEISIAEAQVEVTQEETVSLASQEDLVNPKAQALDFENRFLCEDTGRGYQKCYPQGKYRTIVIVFEGKVVVSPYDEQGPKYEQATFLTTGQSTSYEEEVK